MKENKTRQVIASVIMILIDIVLFILFVSVLRRLIINVVGFDITDYEDWFGELESSRVYRFGAGCYECLFMVLKAAVLIFIEKRKYDKYKGSKILFIIAVIIHVVLFVLCMVYVFMFMEGTNVYWILRYFLTGNEPPF